jgi:hypothetical protein
MFNFILGVLSVAALVFIGVLIFGMVKLFKLNSKVGGLENNFRFDIDHLQRRIDDERREIDIRFSELISYTDRRIDKSLDKKKD